MKPFYRFPCGTFEDLGPPWHVYHYRPMPCTPAGDFVISFDIQSDADKAVDLLNNERPKTIDDALALLNQ